MSDAARIVIVGAGPAGVRAAETLAAAGRRPIVLDEGARWGGQIYRQPPVNFVRSKRTLYGFEASRADSIHTTMAALLPHVDYWPDTLVWDCVGRQLETLRRGRVESVPFSHLILATGATDRILPFPGWTLPGVYTLGAAQIALKAQGCAVGRRVVLAGTGPLLYLVAYQYAKAGARVTAVLDTTPFVRQMQASPRLMSQPAVFAKGLYYTAWLRTHGVPVHRGVTLLGADGDECVTAMRWSENGRARSIACDAVATGFGLRSETQIADLAGCKFVFDTLNRQWLPERDAMGRASVGGIYLAGDGAGIAGADAAELAGRRAALALIDDLGQIGKVPDARRQVRQLQSKLDGIARFRGGLEAAFAMPEDAPSRWPDDMVLCRCEEITVGTVREIVRCGAATEINRVKALTRVGMGRCQGRMCGLALAELLAAETSQPIAAIGRLRGQAPIKPVPLSIAADYPAAISEEARDE
ncbi:FAD/NAD(P)-binding oxidoreductase [Pandoraea terrae]|uniref:FAD/NAD(P)-binding oxidoreductase n=1 Tax=Pandoraea terrae TaxID=1537710 RepID=A0A5E4YIQ5_9BURK|nr:FAD/NAD(P)-binding oxidoreductase [Pandoraea terrae]VVE48320.1 FAD/NAD(P)-binding oxidoreductase [Pandoraea terrae]